MNPYVAFKTKLLFLQVSYLDVPEELRQKMERVIGELAQEVEAILPDEPKEEIKEIGVNLNDWRKR